MDDQNMNSKVEIIGVINPMNMEFEFKEVNYEFSRFFGDRMIGVSQIDESDCIYLDCIKGEMQIRVSMSIEHRNQERSERKSCAACPLLLSSFCHIQNAESDFLPV